MGGKKKKNRSRVEKRARKRDREKCWCKQEVKPIAKNEFLTSDSYFQQQDFTPKIIFQCLHYSFFLASLLFSFPMFCNLQELGLLFYVSSFLFFLVSDLRFENFVED
ncbi:hypothetical protein CFP56_018773 [Quercus suber]|uniref:Uncharacterized protein n=1 Tax=Quercus suber TaxID=58331 RepID=A0AAW0KJL5_QUESU